MSRSARILLAAAAMILAAAVPAAAQSARGTVTASATVVEPIGFAAGPSTVASSRRAIDVTTPVAVRGRAAHVVQVVRAGDAQPRIDAAVRPHPRATSAAGATESAYDVRLRVTPRLAGDPPSAVTYVISTVN
ncbi:hypothetical protein [Longimicrobium sp.]|uniref:hypothetical protein n=1 Tax=Longimicrobium sp. TaxID=2029185 RepID=UPI002B794692|nr:hypothetical protein [Longimicrobium sp.]HSU12508.1 hypothetical protein [Longimicrobium sp.]